MLNLHARHTNNAERQNYILPPFKLNITSLVFLKPCPNLIDVETDSLCPAKK